VLDLFPGGETGARLPDEVPVLFDCFQMSRYFLSGKDVACPHTRAHARRAAVTRRAARRRRRGRDGEIGAVSGGLIAFGHPNDLFHGEFAL